MLAHRDIDVIGTAMYADAISDEGIDRYLGVGLIRHSLNGNGVTYPGSRLKTTWPGAKRSQLGVPGGDVWQCLLILQGIQLSSFASCYRDVLSL